MTKSTTTNLLRFFARINELGEYYCFIPNTCKALPLTPEKKLFGTQVGS